MTILQKITQFVSEQSGHPVEQIDQKSNFDDLGFDSLDLIEVVMYVESEYEIELDDDQIDKIKTVQDLVDCVANMICGNVNDGHACTMPKGSECPDCCGIRGETIGDGD